MARQWYAAGQRYESADTEYYANGQLNEVAASTPITAGTIAFVSSGPAQISLEQTVAPSGGEGTIALQWERNEDGGAYGELTGETGTTLDDTDVEAGVLYGYRIHYTDEGAGDEYSNVVFVEVYSGGAIGEGGAPSIFMSSVIR